MGATPTAYTQTGARAWVASERGVVVPSYPWLCCLQLQLPALSWSPKILTGKFQKQTMPELSTVHCSERRDGASPCPALSSPACVIPLSGVSTLWAIPSLSHLVGNLAARLAVRVSQCSHSSGHPQMTDTDRRVQFGFARQEPQSAQVRTAQKRSP